MKYIPTDQPTASLPEIQVGSEIQTHVDRAIRANFLPQGFSARNLVDSQYYVSGDKTASVTRKSQLPTGAEDVRFSEFHINAPPGNEHHSITRSETLLHEAGTLGAEVQIFTLGNYDRRGRMIRVSRYPVNKEDPWAPLNPANEVLIVTSDTGEIWSLSVGEAMSGGLGEFSIIFGDTAKITSSRGQWDTRGIFDQVKEILGFDPRNGTIDLAQSAAKMLTTRIVEPDGSLPQNPLPKFLISKLK